MQVHTRQLPWARSYISYVWVCRMIGSVPVWCVAGKDEWAGRSLCAPGHPCCGHYPVPVRNAMECPYLLSPCGSSTLSTAMDEEFWAFHSRAQQYSIAFARYLCLPVRLTACLPSVRCFGYVYLCTQAPTGIGEQGTLLLFLWSFQLEHSKVVVRFHLPFLTQNDLFWLVHAIPFLFLSQPKKK